MDYAYKNQQLILVPFPNPAEPQTAIFHVNSLIPIDKIRISVAGQLSTHLTFRPGILLWTDMVNNYIGCVGTKYIGADLDPTYFFGDKLEPNNGVEFFYPNKVMLNGDYNLVFSALDGTSPAAYVNDDGGDDLYLLIEYYSS